VVIAIFWSIIGIWFALGTIALACLAASCAQARQDALDQLSDSQTGADWGVECPHDGGVQ
jgi:hypothetical protein